jgi:hypothetical protein
VFGVGGMSANLDYLMSIPQVHREIYGYSEDEKPNDHCNWQDIGYSKSLMAWVENDAHLRQRIRGLSENKCADKV